MSWILWRKAIRDSLWLFLGCFVVLVFAQWLRVYFVSQIPMKDFILIRDILAKSSRFEPVEKLLPISLDQLKTSEGRISMGFSEPLILVVISVWAVSRGSAVVSGEIARGTMEMILAQPVRRISLMTSQVVVTTVKSFLLALGTVCGTSLGIHFLLPYSNIEIYYFFLASLNLFGFMLMLTAVTTLISAFDRYRNRTIGIIGAFYVLEKIIEMISLLVENLNWLKYFTFFTWLKPPRFVTDPENSFSLCYQYNGIYLSIAVVCYLIAFWRFCNRDMPAPV